MTIARYSLASKGRGPIALVVLFVMAALALRAVFSLGQIDVRSAFMVLWFTILAFAALRLVTAAREIVVHPNDEVEFVSWANSVHVQARDIQSIKATGGRYNRIVVRHTAGRVYLAGNFNGFHQFLSELEKANPGVQFTGC